MNAYHTALYSRLKQLAREQRRMIDRRTFQEKIDSRELYLHPQRLHQCLGRKDLYYPQEPLYVPMFGGYQRETKRLF